MGCNCNSKPCHNCSSGIPCNCPPSYSITPASVNCNCCPPGYSYSSPSTLYPNGICTSSLGTTAPVPCTTCEESIPSDCVIMSGLNNVNDCQQCPPGSTFVGPTPNYPNGYCVDNMKRISAATVCPPSCAVLGIQNGLTLTQIINNLCPTNPAVIQAILQTILLDSTLQAMLCNITSSCPTNTSTVTITSITSYCCPVPFIWIPPYPAAFPTSYPTGACTQDGTSGTIVNSITPYTC